MAFLGKSPVRQARKAGATKPVSVKRSRGPGRGTTDGGKTGEASGSGGASSGGDSSNGGSNSGASVTRKKSGGFIKGVMGFSF